MMKHILLLSLATIFLISGCTSQTQPLNKEQASASIDSLYQQFSASYQTLNVDMVANLYTEDANYLPANSERAIMTSRAEIREQFSTAFEWNKNNNRNLNISFRIIKRVIDDSLAYDVGYYLMKSKPQDKEEFPEDGNVGKFVVAMGLQKDGSWKFLLDGFSPAPFNAFFADSTAHDPVK